MEYRAKLIGAASLLLCVAFTSQALTLGRIRGAALIGQPLNMVVPVQIGAGEDASASCFEADVFHADARQDPSRVRVLVEPTAQADALNIRILSSATVDEPVVTVYLRSLCEQKTTRRYVLLADFPSELGPAVDPIRMPSVPQLAAPAAILAPVAVAAVTERTVGAGVAAPAPAAKPAATPKPKVVKKPVKRPVKKAPALKPVAAVPAALPVLPAAPPGQPRLTLDSPLLLSEQADVLALTTPPGPSAESQRDLLKIQTLESDVKALLALAAKNEASLLDLRTRLQVAESERLPNWMVYLLAALVLACLAVIALLARRRRQDVPADNSHWSASVAAVVPPVGQPAAGSSTSSVPGRVTMPGVLDTWQPTPAVRSPAAAAPALGANEGAVDGPVTQVDVSLLEMSESGFDKLMQSGVAHSAIRKPQPQKPVAAAAASSAESHNLNSSAVFDVRQQAEFFVSLGQTDQAVRILEKHISESDNPNPHVYLDLLAIFHSLSLKVDFRQFREDFNLLFNGRVPEFAAFKDEGKDLEAYATALQSISAVWPSAQVLSVIESLVFRDPWEVGSQPFDLAAFRDLLLLHAVAQRILLASPDIAPSGLAAVAGAATAELAKPYFADSGLSMPLPMPSPYADAAVDAGPGAAAGSAEVDLDLNFDSAHVDLDLDLSDTSTAGTAPAAGQDMGMDMDLDLSLPLSEQMDLALPRARAPAQGNLIDFDISDPVQPPKPDDKTPG